MRFAEPRHGLILRARGIRAIAVPEPVRIRARMRFAEAVEIPRQLMVQEMRGRTRRPLAGWDSPPGCTILPSAPNRCIASCKAAFSR